MRASVIAIVLAGCRFHFDAVGDAGAAGTGDSDSGPPPCVLDVATRNHSSCVLRSDHTVWCAGAGTSGQLGNNSGSDSSVFVQAGPFAPAQQIAVGAYTAYALDTSGNVWGWGNNARYSLGTGTTTRAAAPVQITSGASRIVTGESHACVLDSSGTVSCWGWNSLGQIGNNTMTDQPTPLVILGGVAKLYAGGRQTCVVKQDTTVWCWGWGEQGEIGDGTINDRYVPTLVPGFTPVELVMGGHHTCGLLADGSVWCWGMNQHGEVGDGTTTMRPSPQPVPGIANAVALYPAGGRRQCARLANGENWCWGETPFGAMGPAAPSNGVELAHHVPELDGSTLVATASGHTCMRTVDGTLACSGINASGELADGTTMMRLTYAPTSLSCP